MADFETVIRLAQDGYFTRSDYPPFATLPWDERRIWTEYLSKLNRELDMAEKATGKVMMVEE